MADDVTLPGAGAVVATDEVSSRHYQLVKPAFGPDGSATLVAAGAGLPASADWKEVSGSASANSTDLISVDAAGYSFVCLHFTGTFSANVQFEKSNDGTNWASFQLMRSDGNSVPSDPVTTASTTGQLFSGPLDARYFRARTITYSSGTVAVTAKFNAVAPGSHVFPAVTSIKGTVNISGGSMAANGDAASGSASFGAPGMVYNGATWDRQRGAGTVKTAAATASGSTAIWTPSAGNRWRLQRIGLWITADASMSSAGVLTLDLRDNTTTINVTFSVYLPATAGTAMGSDWFSGWLDLGNGIRSSANTQALNVNLSAALATGTCRVVACGVEGSGTAA